MDFLNDFDAVFSRLPSASALLSRELRLVAANQALLQVTGLSREEAIGQSVLDILSLPPDSASAVLLQRSLAQVLAAKAPHAIDRLPRAGRRDSPGEDCRYLNVTNTPVFDEKGEVALILHQAIDVTAQRHAEAPLTAPDSGCRPTVPSEGSPVLDDGSHLRRLFEQAPGFVCALRGPDHVFELANQAYYQLVGHRQIVGRPVREALPELEGQGFYELLDRVYADCEPYVGRALPLRLQRMPGASTDEVYVDFIYQPIVDASGAVSGIFVQGHDVTETHKLAQEVSYQASHDSLTGLINRREFERRLTLAVAGAPASGEAHALLWIDLDQFKVINDTCGHAAGDELLRQVGQTLRGRIRASDTLARLGGDEFAVLLPACPAEPAQRLAEELLATIGESEFIWEQRRFALRASIGLVVFGDHGDTAREILSGADSACCLAKEKGRGRVQFFRRDDAELSARLKEMDWVGRLRDAIDSGRMILYAQKIRPVSGDSGIDHREILLRLRETDGTLVPPMAFLPAAERYNLMPMIDRYVVHTVIRHLAAMPADQRAHTWYAINLSGKTLDDETFLKYVQAQVAEHGVSPAQIGFEITETAAISQMVQAARLIHELKAQGFRFALDDFGSGMSSFGYLKHLPVDYLKIDGVFVKDIADDPVDRAIVEAIATVARVMGLQTIAEYVENDTILAYLRDLGVDFAQGYGVHRPEPLLAD